MEIQILAWDTHKNMQRLNCLMGSQQYSFFINWIFNWQDKYKQTIKTCSMFCRNTRENPTISYNCWYTTDREHYTYQTTIAVKLYVIIL